MTDLSLISSGTATPSEARSMLWPLVAGANLTLLRRIVTAMRRWLWRALDSRRRDPELREWHDIFKRLRVMMPEHRDLQVSLQALADVLSESVQRASDFDVHEVLQRKHAAQALTIMKNGRPHSRMSLMESLNLNQSNATRFFNLLIEAGLIHSHRTGRDLSYSLTILGLKHVPAQGIYNSTVDTANDRVAVKSRVKGRSRFGRETEILSRDNASDLSVRCLVVGTKSQGEKDSVKNVVGKPIYEISSVIEERSSRNGLSWKRASADSEATAILVLGST